MNPTVKKIVVYPIKGLKGISCLSANALKEGFENDRRYMLIDQDNRFLSQRTCKEMVSFETELLDDRIVVNYQSDKINFLKEEFSNVKMLATIWDDEVEVNEVSENISNWFSNKLNRPVKLVCLNPTEKRIKNYSNREGSTEVSFADGYPYLIVGTASLDLLNEKLKQPIDMSRFRANIIIETKLPHEEDHWRKIKIGNAELEIIKPCTRCQVINIDQQKGTIFKEPLRTLSKYRNKNNKICFGANASCLTTGSITVGDKTILETNG